MLYFDSKRFCKTPSRSVSSPPIADPPARPETGHLPPCPSYSTRCWLALRRLSSAAPRTKDSESLSFPTTRAMTSAQSNNYTLSYISGTWPPLGILGPLDDNFPPHSTSIISLQGVYSPTFWDVQVLTVDRLEHFSMWPRWASALFSIWLLEMFAGLVPLQFLIFKPQAGTPRHPRRPCGSPTQPWHAAPPRGRSRRHPPSSSWPRVDRGPSRERLPAVATPAVATPVVEAAQPRDRQDVTALFDLKL